MLRVAAALLRFAYAFFLSLDLLLSALTFGAPWETISARLGNARNRGNKFFTLLADIVDVVALYAFNQPDHCETSILAYHATILARIEMKEVNN